MSKDNVDKVLNNIYVVNILMENTKTFQID